MAKSKPPGWSHGPIAPMTSPPLVTSKPTPLVVKKTQPSKPMPVDGTGDNQPVSPTSFKPPISTGPKS